MSGRPALPSAAEDAAMIQRACERATARYREKEAAAARLREASVTLDEIAEMVDLPRSAVHLALVKRGLR